MVIQRLDCRAGNIQVPLCEVPSCQLTNYTQTFFQSLWQGNSALPHIEYIPYRSGEVQNGHIKGTKEYLRICQQWSIILPFVTDPDFYISIHFIGLIVILNAVQKCTHLYSLIGSKGTSCFACWNLAVKPSSKMLTGRV